MTKVLYVSGEADYTVLTYEEHFNEEKRIEHWHRARKAPQHKLELGGFMEGINWDIDIKAYKFEDIDPEFISFIREYIQDYDDSKHRNFYIIK